MHSQWVGVFNVYPGPTPGALVGAMLRDQRRFPPKAKRKCRLSACSRLSDAPMLQKRGSSTPASDELFRRPFAPGNVPDYPGKPLA